MPSALAFEAMAFLAASVTLAAFLVSSLAFLMALLAATTAAGGAFDFLGLDAFLTAFSVLAFCFFWAALALAWTFFCYFSCFFSTLSADLEGVLAFLDAFLALSTTVLIMLATFFCGSD